MGFYDKLERGDLVLATGVRTSKLHLVIIHESKNENKGAISDDGLAYWTGTALCGNDGNRYFWSPRLATDVSPNDKSSRCHRCWQRWRALGRSEVVGWSPEDVPDSEILEYPPPTAWEEVPAQKHPRDVGPDGKPEDVLDKAGEPAGIRRTELRRWRRGPRIVRIVELHDKEARATHAVLVHRIDEPGLKENTRRYGTLAECREHAHRVMAIGGYE